MTQRRQAVPASATVESIEVAAKVIRCGCGDPLNVHERDAAGALLPCPTPRDVEPLGVISSYQRPHGLLARLKEWF